MSAYKVESRYRVYDTKANDQIIGDFTAKQISKIYGVKLHSVRQAISNDSCIRHRYYCVKVKDRCGRWLDGYGCT